MHMLSVDQLRSLMAAFSSLLVGATSQVETRKRSSYLQSTYHEEISRAYNEER